MFYCGEYGGKTKRPHYHALLFNYEPTDGELLRQEDDKRIYESAELSKLWYHGLCEYGDLTFESAAYTARYCTKKITGDDAEKHYTWACSQTGEITLHEPEFCGMSLKPTIGLPWIKKWLYDVYPKDQIILKGRKMSPPRYYDKYLEKQDPKLFLQVKKNRLIARLKHEEETNEYTGSGRQMLTGLKIAQTRLQKRNQI